MNSSINYNTTNKKLFFLSTILLSTLFLQNAWGGPTLTVDTPSTSSTPTVQLSPCNGLPLDYNPIRTAQEFQNITPSQNYYLCNDISLNGVIFNPQFFVEGNLDGGNKTISNLKIIRKKIEGVFRMQGHERGQLAEESLAGVSQKIYDEYSENCNVGLFSYLYNVRIKNLKLRDADITGSCNLGVLAGSAHNSVFENVHIYNSKLNGDSGIGGMIGAGSVEILNSSVNSITIIGNEVLGGIAGSIVSKNIYNVTASGLIGSISSRIVGGIVGLLNYTDLNKATFTGTLQGKFSIGGLIGYSNSSVVRNGRTGGRIKASVVADDAFSGSGVGGLIGITEIYSGTKVITDSFSRMSVMPAETGTSFQSVGGLIGEIMFWDVHTSGWSNLLDSVTLSTNSYASGAITTPLRSGKGFGVGGLVGSLRRFDGITAADMPNYDLRFAILAISSYWNSSYSTNANSIGIPKTDAELKSGTPFLNWSTNIWSFAISALPNLKVNNL